ncbi:MAG: alpha/beta hydrolase [Victivallales bacterium]|nr:alpha/beta hydrolase [Victivallales bacterium]
MTFRFFFVTVFLAAILLVPNTNAAPRKTEIDGAAGKLSILLDIPPARETIKGPVVILCHGFTSWKGEPLLVAVAEAATKAGFPVVRFDFNGHGESGGDFSKMTVSSEVDDLRRVMEWAGKQPWGGDFLLVGHSQGGVVVGMACGLYNNIKGAVLLAPAGVLVDDSKSGRIFDARIDPANPPETIPLFGGTRLLGGCYVRDAQKLPLYETVAKAGSRGVHSLCVIHGSADGVVPYSYGKRFTDAASSAAVPCQAEFHLLYGADHGFSQREKEVADLTVFLLKKMEKLP